MRIVRKPTIKTLAAFVFASAFYFMICQWTWIPQLALRDGFWAMMMLLVAFAISLFVRNKIVVGVLCTLLRLSMHTLALLTALRVTALGWGLFVAGIWCTRILGADNTLMRIVGNLGKTSDREYFYRALGVALISSLVYGLIGYLLARTSWEIPPTVVSLPSPPNDITGKASPNS